MSKYVSSLISKYGDSENVQADAKTIIDIQARQGNMIFLDVLADLAGSLANQLDWDDESRETLINSLIKDFKDALNERL